MPTIARAWHRKEWTTRGPDPTTVVEWMFTHDDVRASIIEFQNIYRGTGFLADMDTVFLTWLHRNLEDNWESAMCMHERTTED